MRDLFCNGIGDRTYIYRLSELLRLVVRQSCASVRVRESTIAVIHSTNCY